MTTAAKKTHDEILTELNRPQPDEIANAEIVTGKRSGYAAPISVRLSPPLLERLDRLARSEHRKRGNLIQHILWEYIRSHSD